MHGAKKKHKMCNYCPPSPRAFSLFGSNTVPCKHFPYDISLTASLGREGETRVLSKASRAGHVLNADVA